MSSAELYGLKGWQNFAAVAQFGESADMGYLESYVTKRMRRPKSEVPGSIPGRRVMPGDTSAGDTVFDGEEKSEEQESEGSESEVVGRYKISPLTLTVFEREVDGTVYHEVNLQRTYPKDDEASEFGYTESMRPRDLRKAGRLFEKAADDLQGFTMEKIE